MEETIKWAKGYITFLDSEIETIMQACEHLLYSKGQPWMKSGDCNFDVAVGSYHGAETCEFCGLMILFFLQKIGVNLGIYRDDGLTGK